MKNEWEDGIGVKRLWTNRVKNVSHWERLVEARKVLIAKAIAWKTAAIADGWTCEPTYGDHESADTAFTLKRDGFVAQGIARPANKDTVGSGKINCWGPDGIAVEVGTTYDFQELLRGLKTCHYCRAYPVETERVAFADRACAKCRPIEQAKLPRNWCD